MTSISRFSSAAALVAAFSMAATPVFAADISAPVAPYAAHNATTVAAPWSADSVTVQHDGYRRHHNDGIDAGDVLGGLLVVGVIAAVASAASRPKQPRSYPAQYPSRPNDYQSPRSDPRYNSQGIDRAADMCVREIERDVRVSGVDAVERSADGWRVSGTLYNGDGFTCQIGPDGRVEDVNYSGRQSAQLDGTDRQWSNDRYTQAWANNGAANNGAANNAAGNTSSDSAQGAAPSGTPAYPGGPLPGEDGYGDDGRYNTSDAPDFGG